MYHIHNALLWTCCFDFKNIWRLLSPHHHHQRPSPDFLSLSLLSSPLPLTVRLAEEKYVKQAERVEVE